ncbi:MAG: RDD family protein [Candidatus Sulfotelmatobacter sp.]
MPCPLCGDICRCSSDSHSGALPRWLADNDVTADESLLAAAPAHDLQQPPGADVPDLGPSAESSAPDSKDGKQPAPEDSAAWRQEVAARLNRYQLRRKPRPPRYPSLQRHFEEENIRTAPDISAEPSTLPDRMPSSNQALALDTFAESDSHGVEIPTSAPPTTAPIPAPVTGKLIEFPRSWTPPPARFDELAEPVIDRGRPRILEAPEVVPPPPALGGITIETVERPEAEKRPGVDIPVQSAPLARRIFAAGVDGVVITAACALFAFVFWKVAAIRPPRLEIIGLAAGLSGLFWAVYQYLLLVYSGTTPGLLLARLELARFDGSPASRRLRHWRVLASFLSAASLGMGYAWVFLDEDSLCWHDRITHTYLAPKG